MTRKAVLRTGLIAAVAGCAFAGIAYAAIPDSNGVIQGCYKTVGGDLRVIDAGAGGACKPSEQSLDWPGEQRVVIRTATQTIQPGAAHTFSALCHEGERATGGGYRVLAGFTTPELLPLMTAAGSVPIQSGSGEPEEGDVPDISIGQFVGADKGRNRLNLSTLHSAKGREFDVGILFGIDDGRLPRGGASERELIEARRLFYVGFTRARLETHIVYSRDRPSRFVTQLRQRIQS